MDSYIQAPPDSTGKLIDTEQVVVGANNVQRQRVNVMNAPHSPQPTPLSSAAVGIPATSGVDLVAAPAAGNHIEVWGIWTQTYGASTIEVSYSDGGAGIFLDTLIGPAAPFSFQPSEPLSLPSGKKLAAGNTSPTDAVLVNLLYRIVPD